MSYRDSDSIHKNRLMLAKLAPSCHGYNICTHPRKRQTAPKARWELRPSDICRLVCSCWYLQQPSQMSPRPGLGWLGIDLINFDLISTPSTAHRNSTEENADMIPGPGFIRNVFAFAPGGLLQAAAHTLSLGDVGPTYHSCEYQCRCSPPICGRSPCDCCTPRCRSRRACDASRYPTDRLWRSCPWRANITTAKKVFHKQEKYLNVKQWLKTIWHKGIPPQTLWSSSSSLGRLRGPVG